MRQTKSEFASMEVHGSAARLGERIRRARKSRRISLEQLESMCRVHRSTLGRLERGDVGVSLGTVLMVLEALHELSDIELLLSQPETPKHQRVIAPPPLDREF